MGTALIMAQSRSTVAIISNNMKDHELLQAFIKLLPHDMVKHSIEYTVNCLKRLPQQPVACP